MQTIAETRLARLKILLKSYGDSNAALSEAIGLTRTDATISQIRTRAHHSKTGTPRAMGDTLARKIENSLHLPTGWMDTPPTPLEHYGQSDPRAKAWELMVRMPENELETAYRLLNALANPAPESQAEPQPQPEAAAAPRRKRPVLQPWLPQLANQAPHKKQA